MKMKRKKQPIMRQFLNPKVSIMGFLNHIFRQFKEKKKKKNTTPTMLKEY